MAVAPTAATFDSLGALGGLETGGAGPTPSLTSLVDVMNGAGVASSATPAAGTPVKPKSKAKSKAKAKAVPQAPKSEKEMREGARS